MAAQGIRGPKGTEIIGTLERLSGTAYILSARRLPDGSLDIDYDGETEVWWDGQKTQVRQNPATGESERIFIDENYEEVLESELVMVPVDDDGVEIPSDDEAESEG